MIEISAKEWADFKKSKASKGMETNRDAGAIQDVQVATSYNFSHDDTITLIVGPEEAKMTVHGAYLTRDSEFFKTALKKEWVGGQTRTIKLPEEDPETMGHYMTFVYEKKLPLDDLRPDKREHFDARWPILIDLWLYGERFVNRTIQNAAIKEIFRLTCIECRNGLRWYPSRENVDRIYQGTLEGSHLRRLILDMHITMGAPGWFSAGADGREFLLDLTKDLYEKMRQHNAFDEFRYKDLNVENYLSTAQCCHLCMWRGTLLT
jgi:hypothetical protein